MPHKPSPGQGGVTLIELMIAVAIVAIISAIAYPSYQSHIQRTRRATATACLLELAQQMERRLTTSMAYDSDATLPSVGCAPPLAAHYNFGFAANEPTSTTYKVTAAPTGAQAGDSCGTLQLNQLGVKSVSGTATMDSCWR